MDTLRALRVLGLPPGSSTDDIKAAWRDLARVWHPDRFAQDPRLQQKAGDNLTRINQAYEALRNYDPTERPRVAARMRESVAIIFGIGELGEPPPAAEILQPSFTPDGPVGTRDSVRVLGLNVPRYRVGRRLRKTWLMAAAAGGALALAALLYFLLR